MPVAHTPFTVETYNLGELQTNCYLLWENESREALLIDPADSGDFLSQSVRELDLHLSAIVLTHGHFDHVLGLLELRLNFPDVPICLHPEDVPLLQRAQQSAEHWLKHAVDPVPHQTLAITEASVFTLGTHQIGVVETPGHTPGSICLSAQTNHAPLLFTGDTLFKDGVGRTDFSYSKPLQLELSIRKIFDTFPENTICFPGHGEPTTIGAEQVGR